MMREILEKLKPRETRLLLIGLGATISVAVCVTAVLPMVKALAVANNDNRLSAVMIENSGDLQSQLEQQLAVNDSFRHRLQGDMASLPLQQVEAFVIGRLQRVSWNNDVELVSVEPATGEQIQVFQEVLFRVNLVGEYEDLFHWLLETREELGFVVVKEFSLQRENSVDSEPRLFANLSLASYRAIQ